MPSRSTSRCRCSLLSHPLQHLLSWSPDDPSPFPDLPFYPGEPLHTVMSPTDDQNVFSLTDFDDLFDSTCELEILMGPNMMPSLLLDMSQYMAFTNNLFFDLDAQVQAQFRLPGAGTVPAAWRRHSSSCPALA